MTEPQSAMYSPAYDHYNMDYSKHQQQQQSLDFFSFHSPSDILAPHPDLFESDIDTNLAAFDQLQLLTVDNDAFSLLRSDFTGPAGPLSTITVSSESAYDSLSSHSESFYNDSSAFSQPALSFQDLEMDFQRVRVGSEYAVTHPGIGIDDTVDPTSFGTLPPTPPRSPPVNLAAKPYGNRSSLSDYDYRPPRHTSFYGEIGYSSPVLPHSTISPLHINTQLPPPAPANQVRVSEEYKGDPRKKYRCAACPRSFARAYNLKTHMATHDPNRLKPHVCPHRACGRSFSRKHDLGRHLVSIHRDESVCSTQSSVTSKKSIGVEKGPRGWCDNCGKGWVGRNDACDCNDVK